MKELRVILLNLKVVSTHAKAITEALGEKPNRLIFSGKTKHADSRGGDPQEPEAVAGEAAVGLRDICSRFAVRSA